MSSKNPTDTRSSLIPKFLRWGKSGSADTSGSGLPKIPRFKLLDKLGEGGMASVYLAEQENTGRLVAIKIMATHLQADSHWTERFLDEARRLAELSHPNIVPVFDWGTHEGIGYIVMEYIKGGDLTHRLNHVRITVRDAIDIARQIASGLDFAGEKGYVHRDIKPENILFRENGSPCILDFGIAKDSSTNTTISSQGLAIGTGAYMSPEQAQPGGRNLDTRSDLYSLGVLLYEMLQGSRPFEYRHMEAIQAFQLYIYAHLNSPPPPLSVHFSAFQPIIDKLLAKNPDDRFERGQDLKEALTRLEGEAAPALLAKPLRIIDEKTIILTPSSSSSQSEAHSSSINSVHGKNPSHQASPNVADSLIPGTHSTARHPTHRGTATGLQVEKKANIMIPVAATVIVLSAIASYIAYDQLLSKQSKPPQQTATITETRLKEDIASQSMDAAKRNETEKNQQILLTQKADEEKAAVIIAEQKRKAEQEAQAKIQAEELARKEAIKQEAQQMEIQEKAARDAEQRRIRESALQAERDKQRLAETARKEEEMKRLEAEKARLKAIEIEKNRQQTLEREAQKRLEEQKRQQDIARQEALYKQQQLELKKRQELERQEALKREEQLKLETQQRLEEQKHQQEIDRQAELEKKRAEEAAQEERKSRSFGSF